MAILSQDDYIAAAKQTLSFTKTGAATTAATFWVTSLDLAGNPGAGSLAIGDTTNGIVPTDATAGFPAINAFAGGARGYLTQVEYGNSVASRFFLYDRLFHAGSVALTSLATTTLASQPSFASRVSLAGGSPDYKGLQLWLEINAAVSATATTVQVQYTNEAGVTGRLTAAQSVQSYPTRRCYQLALDAGDKGVQAVEAIIVGGTVATLGSVNIFVARPLWFGRVHIANDGDLHGWDKTGFVEVFDSSAIGLLVAADGSSTGVPDLQIEIASK